VDSVDQLRQDFGVVRLVSATPTGVRFSDSPVRDQEVGGSNPLAPTTHSIFIGYTFRLLLRFPHFVTT